MRTINFFFKKKSGRAADSSWCERVTFSFGVQFHFQTSEADPWCILRCCLASEKGANITAFTMRAPTVNQVCTQPFNCLRNGLREWSHRAMRCRTSQRDSGWQMAPEMLERADEFRKRQESGKFVTQLPAKQQDISGPPCQVCFLVILALTYLFAPLLPRTSAEQTEKDLDC